MKTRMKKDLSAIPTLRLDSADLKLRDSDSLLASPDPGLLKLGSPDLERLLIQSNGMVTTTPGGPFLYPKTPAPDEQEFAEGFVKALEDLHKQNQLNGTGTGAGQTGAGSLDLDLGASIAPGPGQPDFPVYTTLNSFGSGALGTLHYSTDTVPYPNPGPPAPPAPPGPGLVLPAPPDLTRVQPLKEEPQTVPDVQSFGDSPPLSPVDLDLDSQERIKAERKRLRNRIAATKCRRRKLERISRLEDKVKTLKDQNSDLASTAGLLRDQVDRLKDKVLTHLNSGCQLLPHEVQVH